MSCERGKSRLSEPDIAKGIMLVFSNVEPGRAEEFNAWYDQTHVPEVLAYCEEVESCQRYRLSQAQLQNEQSHQFLAAYEFEGDPADFLANLQKANERFEMNDSLIDAKVIILDPITLKVTAD